MRPRGFHGRYGRNCDHRRDDVRARIHEPRRRDDDFEHDLDLDFDVDVDVDLADHG